MKPAVFTRCRATDPDVRSSISLLWLPSQLASGGCTALDRHWHAESWTERNERVWFDFVPWDQVKTIVLDKCCEHEMRLNERELVANTLSRTGAKRQIGKLRPICDALRREAIGIEHFRIRPECGQAVQDVRDDQREPSSRQGEPAELVIGQCLPGERPGRWIQSHGFVQYHARVRQISQIG